MSVLDEIGATVIYLRKEKGLTQERLALECAISVSYLRLIEHGNATPQSMSFGGLPKFSA